MSVLYFNTMVGAFGNFSDPGDWGRFARRMAHYGSLWCCVEPPKGQPGHIHYDLLWDVPGHRDRFGRLWDGWEPKPGP